jgi:hypothetical protein
MIILVLTALRPPLGQREGRIGDYQLPYGWQEVDLNEGNVSELQPRCCTAFNCTALHHRMGHLLLDGVFDEEKYERGMIKLLNKRPPERDEDEVIGTALHCTALHCTF